MSLDWRGGASYAAKLLMPSEYQQSILPFKQKKATTSSAKAMHRLTMESVTTTIIKNECSLKPSAGGIAAPVVYDLSDSEGTPTRRLVRSLAERRAVSAKPASASRKQFANAEVVTLDSDSDEEVFQAAAFKFSGKVEKLRQPSTQGSSGRKVISLHDEGKVDSKLAGKVDKLREPVSQRGLLEKAISVDDDGTVLSRFSGNVVKFTATMPQGGSFGKAISLDDGFKVGTKLAGKVDELSEPVSQGRLHERAISVDDEGTVGLQFPEKVVKLTKTNPQGGSHAKGLSLDMEGMVGSISSRTDVPVAETAVLVQTCDLSPRWDDAFSRVVPSTTLTSPEYVGAFDEIFQAICGSRKRPSSPAGCSNQSDPAQGAIRKCLRPTHEEKRRSFLVQPAFQDLISSDDEASPSAKFLFSGKLGTPREPIPQGGILGKHLSVGNKGTIGSISSTTDVDVALKGVTAYIADLSSRWDDASPKAGPPSISDPLAVKPNRVKESNVSACDNYLQTSFGSGELPNSAAEGPQLLDAQEATRKCLRAANVCAREENRGSSPVQPAFQDLTSDDDGCGSEPEWLRRDHEPASLMRSGNSGGSVPHNYWDEECREQFLPNLGGSGEVNDRSGGKKRPLYIPCLESHENCETHVSSRAAEAPKMLDQAHGAKRNCIRAVHDFVRKENRRSSPIQPAFQILTGDDDDCSSDPEWLRKDELVSLSLNNGGSVAHDFSGQGLHDQFLPRLGGNSEPSDHVTGKKRRSLQISGLESHENREAIVSSSAKDLESDGGLLVEDKAKRKRSRTIGAATERRGVLDYGSDLKNVGPGSRNVYKARKGTMSDEEVAAREALKQRERELKKARQEEEKKAKEEKREDLKRQREAAKEAAKQQKEEAAERRRLEKENNRWMKGKFALQNTTVHLEKTVVEMKDLGSLILHQLGSKGYTYKIAPNPIQGTVLWKMKRPSADSQTDTEGLGSQADDVVNSQLSNSQLALEEVEMKYVVVVLQGEEFADLVARKTLYGHLSRVRKRYPAYSVCYLINGLKKLLCKREQHQYKTGDQRWTRPNVEQALAEFITHYPDVHSRLCMDESEIADHLVGLTRSLAECPFKKKLTSISVNASGDHVTKNDPNKDVIKKSTWLKFLVAIPHISGAIAIAIAQEYPTMRALLDAYLDPFRTVYDKELLLEGLLKDIDGDKRVSLLVSKRIYRVLMAKDGSLSTDDAEQGADHFTS